MNEAVAVDEGVAETKSIDINPNITRIVNIGMVARVDSYQIMIWEFF